MPSSALHEWKTTRALQLDRLEATHRTIMTAGRGRKWETEHINFALITRLSAEFQAFCRDLHDESTDALVSGMAISNQQLQLLARAAFIQDRALNTGNATNDNVRKDFARLGISLWDEMQRTFSLKHRQDWLKMLDSLNKARNAIAHSDQVKLAKCRQDQPLTLFTARRWRKALGDLAVGMDQVVGAYLETTVGLDPW